VARATAGDLGVSPRPEPTRRGRVAWRRSWTRRVGTPTALDRSRQPDRSFPASVAQRAALRRMEQPGFPSSSRLPNGRPGDELVDERRSPGALVFQGVDEHLTRSSAGQHSPLKAEPRPGTRSRSSGSRRRGCVFPPAAQPSQDLSGALRGDKVVRPAGHIILTPLASPDRLTRGLTADGMTQAVLSEVYAPQHPRTANCARD
jgi:hypothetical protein